MKKQCFISHCSDDRDIIEALHVVLRENFDPGIYDFFNTSQEEHSTLAGQGLSDALREALTESEIMIAVITDSYLRSPVCISELSAFWFLNKPVVPLVYSKYGAQFLTNLMGQTVIYIDLTSLSEGDADSSSMAATASVAPAGSHAKETQKHVKKLINTLRKAEFNPADTSRFTEDLLGFFAERRQSRSTRPYIGSDDTYERINRYCEDYGISLFLNTSLSSKQMISRLRSFKRIYILSTTGAGLINSLSSEFIPSALAGGTDITVLIPNRYSSYVNDVAEIESPGSIEEHKKRFAREFDGVVYNLKECLKRSRTINPNAAGEIYLGCAHTALRQTITLGVRDTYVWGWLSMTMPPKRTVDGTPSMEFSGRLSAKSEADRGAAANGTILETAGTETVKPSIAALAYEHILSIRDMAERRHHLVKLSDHPDFTSFLLENDAAEKYWRDLYKEARSETLLRDGDSELIEVAAQHPLRANGMPGKEFALRLDAAVRLYQELEEAGTDAYIYVPGSVHCDDKGKADPCSLSTAGRNYLIKKGIPEDVIFADDANEKYKGDKGVYNTADECYVASRLFFDGDYGRLHCVCSPNQLYRKKLFYIAFGVIPYYHTVNTDKPAHDDIYELFHSIPDVLFEDHTWQDEDSVNGNRTRNSRDPRLVGKTDR